MNAKDLLHITLDLVCYYKNAESLAPAHPARKSYTIRLQQIEALMHAFEIMPLQPNSANEKSISPLEYFVTGGFLKDRLLAYNKELFDEIVETVKTIKPVELFPSDYHPVKVIYVTFSNLFRYRQAIHPFAKTKGLLDHGFTFGGVYSNHLQNQVNEDIQKNIVKIDEVLSRIIDTQQKEISLKTLKNKYDYPDVDLKEFDEEYLM